MPDVDVRTYSPLTLAYIGDGVFDLVIRSLVVAGGNTRASALHRRTSQIVKARTQAQMIERLLPELTQEEEEIYRRGRNAKSPTMAKKRICGSGGWFGYYGWFSEPSIGKYFAYYGKASDCFLVTLKDGKKYVLGCESPDEMVEVINKLIK